MQRGQSEPGISDSHSFVKRYSVMDTLVESHSCAARYCTWRADGGKLKRQELFSDTPVTASHRYEWLIMSLKLPESHVIVICLVTLGLRTKQDQACR